MKKLHILLFFLCFYQNSEAQESKSLLWEISGKNLEKPSYLYGTVHSICKEKVNISTEFRRIIKSVDRVYLEINFNEELNDFKAHFDAFNKSGKKLHEYFTKEEYKILEKKFNEKFGKKELFLTKFSNYKPDEILKSILPKIGICNTTWTSYEAEISKIAKRNDNSIYGLETFEEHNSFQVEHDTTIAKKAKKFFEIITQKESLDEVVKEYQTILELYINEDIEKLYDFSIAESTPEETEKVLHFRNQLWIPRISVISSHQQALYAVGAAHLGGEKGVINLLRKEGFTLKPIID